MACNCNQLDYKCLGTKTSTDCVIWAGDPVPALDICTGDPLTYVEEQILNYIVDQLEQADLPVDVDLSTCVAMQQALAGRDKTVNNLLQILIDNQCTLADLIQQVEDKIPIPTPYAFQLKCVAPVGANNDPNAIIQGIINELCELADTVADLGSNIDEIIDTKIGDFLSGAITSLGNRGIQKTGTGSSTAYKFLALVPPLCPIPYVGPLSNFDGQGKGVVGTAYEGWYLMNGNFGNMDFRGRTVVASLNGVPGATLSPAVDPSNPLNPGTNYTNGATFGEHFHVLSGNEIPSHSHPLTDPGHVHVYLKPALQSNADKGGIPDYIAATDGNTSAAFTGISIQNFGGGQRHENRQPSIAVTGYIIRLD